MTVYLCDVNVWLALALSKHVHHTAARKWLDSVEPTDAVVFCRSTQHALLRLLTNPAVLAPYGNRPLTNEEAWFAYQAFLEDDRITCQSQEPEDIESVWQAFALRRASSPKLWTDAYLAAFAMAAGYRLVTTDSAFRQFPGLELLLLA